MRWDWGHHAHASLTCKLLPRLMEEEATLLHTYRQLLVARMAPRNPRLTSTETLDGLFAAAFQTRDLALCGRQHNIPGGTPGKGRNGDDM